LPLSALLPCVTKLQFIYNDYYTTAKIFFYIFISEQGVIPLSAATLKLFPAKTVSRLSSWKRETYEDVALMPQMKRIVEGGFLSRNDMLFCAVLERGSGQCELYSTFILDLCSSIQFNSIQLFINVLHI
jgi:hypothetical protein